MNAAREDRGVQVEARTLSGVREALKAGVEEYENVRRWNDWSERRGLFAALDLFDEAWNERPDDRAAIGPALDLIWTMLHELNDRRAGVGRTRVRCTAQTTYKGSTKPLFCDGIEGHYPETPHTDPNAAGTTATGYWWEADR